MAGSRQFAANHELKGSEVERYSRQLILPHFGISSQQNLKTSSILIVGVGGLGCPAALYLAGAGVGRLGLVDRPNDVVEKSNLHRQVAHSETRVGTNKVDSAETAVLALNSTIHVIKHKSFEQLNALQLVREYDLVLDCTDNVMSRYLISDACAAERVPLISGSAIGMEGQLTVYCSSEEAPCYRCIFPKPPPPSCVGSCDSAGVIGPVPGIIGTLQALEALKLIGKIGLCEILERKLLLFDGTDSSFRTVKLRSRSTDCAACGPNPINVAKFDYESFASGPTGFLPTPWPHVRSDYRLSATEFAKLRKEHQHYRLIDVRPRTEFDMCHLDEAENIPLNHLTSSEIKKATSGGLRTVFICRRGNASRSAVDLALKEGVPDVCDVIGGLQSWHASVDKEFPLY